MKEKTPIIEYKPSTHAIFNSLSCAPEWATQLVGKGKEYEAFLKGLLDNKFFVDNKERTTIKTMAALFGFKPLQVTKWLEKIYDDIFELNAEEPERFKAKGIKHALTFHYVHGGSAWLNIWLETTPRIHETLHCYFVKAKVGFERFWVKDVSHVILEGEQEIDVFLEGGFCNKYREWLFDRAQFERTIGFMDTMRLKDYEIDKILLDWYRK